MLNFYWPNLIKIVWTFAWTGAVMFREPRRTVIFTLSPGLVCSSTIIKCESVGNVQLTWSRALIREESAQGWGKALLQMQMWFWNFLSGLFLCGQILLGVLTWAYLWSSCQSFDHKKPPVCGRTLSRLEIEMGGSACFLALTTCHFQQQHAITWSVWPSSGCRGPPCKCWMWNRHPVISCCRKQFTPMSSHPLPDPRRHPLIWSAGWCSICSLSVNMPPFAELLQVKKSLEGAAKNLWSILWENK